MNRCYLRQDNTDLFIKIVLLTLVVIYFFFGVNIASAEGEPPMDDGRKVVRVGYYYMSSVQEGTNDDEQKVGCCYDYLQNISYITGWQYKYVYGNYSDLLKKLKNGEIDIMGGIPYNKDISEKIYYSDNPLGEVAVVLYAKDKNEALYNNGNRSFLNKKIVVADDSISTDIFYKWAKANNVLGYELSVITDIKDRVFALNNDYIDLVISPYLKSSSDEVKDWVIVQRLGNIPIYFGVSKNRADLLEELNTAQINILNANPYYNMDVYHRYFKNMNEQVTALTSEEIEWVSRHKKIKIGYLEDCLPYSMIERTEIIGPAGLVRLAGGKLEKNYNISVEYEAYKSYDAMLDAVQSHKIDVAFPILGNHWLAEKAHVFLTNSFHTTSMYAIYAGEISDPFKLKWAYSDAQPLGEKYGKIVYGKENIHKYENVEECLEAVNSGEVDMYIVPHSIFQVEKRKHFLARNLQTILLPNGLDVCFAVSQNSPKLIGILNKCIASIPESEIQATISYLDDIEPNYSLLERIKENSFLWGSFSVILIIILAWGFAAYYHITTKNASMLRAVNVKAEKLLEREEALNEELKKAQDKAIHDPLTGLLNKGAFEDMMQNGISNEKQMALLVIDVDFFKRVNDTWGHAVGDGTLKRVATTMGNFFRPTDFLFRIGGDEFAVILVDIGEKQKQSISAKMQHILNTLNTEEDGLPPITLSIGITFMKNGQTAKEIFECTDRALYEVKENGRNGFAYA